MLAPAELPCRVGSHSSSNLHTNHSRLRPSPPAARFRINCLVMDQRPLPEFCGPARSLMSADQPPGFLSCSSEALEPAAPRFLLSKSHPKTHFYAHNQSSGSFIALMFIYGEKVDCYTLKIHDTDANQCFSHSYIDIAKVNLSTCQTTPRVCVTVSSCRCHSL